MICNDDRDEQRKNTHHNKCENKKFEKTPINMRLHKKVVNEQLLIKKTNGSRVFVKKLKATEVFPGKKTKETEHCPWLRKKPGKLEKTISRINNYKSEFL